MNLWSIFIRPLAKLGKFYTAFLIKFVEGVVNGILETLYTGTSV